MSSPNKDFQRTVRSIKKFINDGNIFSNIKNGNCSVMPIIKFISFDAKGELKVLLGGKCPNCLSEHIRNTCNVRYCSEVIDPIMSKKFELFTSSVPLLTHDPNIEEIVNSCKHKISYKINPHSKKTFLQLETFMLDHHPDIDTTVKMLTLRKKNTLPFKEIDEVSMNDIVKKYNFMFVLMNDTRLMCKDGTFLVGVEKIRNSVELLLDGFYLKEKGNTFVLFTRGVPQFNSKNYVFIE